jgi:hypothetical protein
MLISDFFIVLILLSTQPIKRQITSVNEQLHNELGVNCTT